MLATNGTTINNVINVQGNSNTKKASKNITVEGNKFDISIPSIEVNYKTTPYTTYSEGIVFFFCEDIKFVDNRLNMNYNTYELGKYDADSSYAVSVTSNENAFDIDGKTGEVTYPIISKNVVISDNIFNVAVIPMLMLLELLRILLKYLTINLM